MGGNSKNWKVNHNKLACTKALSGKELAGNNLAEITCLNVNTIPRRQLELLIAASWVFNSDDMWKPSVTMPGT